MDISTVSNNTFVNQVSNVASNKQIHQVNQVDDANVSSVLKSSQNIGVHSKRNIERTTESERGKAFNANENKRAKHGQDSESTKLDIYV